MICLEVVADVLEDRSDLRAKQNQRADDDNRYQGDDKSVLHEALTTVARKQAYEHFFDSPHLNSAAR